MKTPCRLLIVFAANVICAGCNSKNIERETTKSPAPWDVTYFALDDEYQAVPRQTTIANSIVEGRIETSEIYLRSSGDNGLPLPCDIFREGQFVENDSGKSFPVNVALHAGLFEALKHANGKIVRLHVTDEVINDAFQISCYNVAAIEQKR